MEWGQAAQDECLNPKGPQEVVGSQGRLKGEYTLPMEVKVLHLQPRECCDLPQDLMLTSESPRMPPARPTHSNQGPLVRVETG